MKISLFHPCLLHSLRVSECESEKCDERDAVENWRENIGEMEELFVLVTLLLRCEYRKTRLSISRQICIKRRVRYYEKATQSRFSLFSLLSSLVYTFSANSRKQQPESSSTFIHFPVNFAWLLLFYVNPASGSVTKCEAAKWGKFVSWYQSSGCKMFASMRSRVVNYVRME